MLVDQIIAYPDTITMPPEMDVAYRHFGTKLKSAHRFVLNRDAVMTIHSISESTPKRFLQALGICRMPFTSMWVEFSFKDRSDWMADAAKRGLTIETMDNSSPPARLGFYMEQSDQEGKIISVIPCWSHPNHNTVSICHMALKINTSLDNEKQDAKQREYFRQTIADFSKEKKKVYHRWMNSEEEIESGFLLESKIDEQIPEFMKPIWLSLMASGKKDVVEKMMELSRFDLKSEWRFVLSLLTVLNSRNVIEIGPETDLTKVNKSRQKNGVKPLMTHREIRINMSRVQKNRLGGSYNSRDMQSHIVRGHWKLRSTGLFFWNPHVRGIGGDVPVTTTIVRG